MSYSPMHAVGRQTDETSGHTWNIRSEALPSEMQILLAEYPRESWQSHPGFKEKTEGWLGAHQMFKRVIASITKDTEDYIEQTKEPREFEKRLSYRGSVLIGNLHGHHNWEDHSYFPELSAADSRFDAGLEILEKDHATLNDVLEEFANEANRVLQLMPEDDTVARAEAGKLHTVTCAIETLLQRHLGDEEELAVPIILHHRLRG